MDYEKRYKAAMEKAKELHLRAVLGGNTLIADRYEQIFPELSGFEDEDPGYPVEWEDEDPGIAGKDFIPIEWVDACERYGRWEIVKKEGTK